jgi:hypothetical protein
MSWSHDYWTDLAEEEAEKRAELAKRRNAEEQKEKESE